MTTTASMTTSPNPSQRNVGERVELARYTIRASERALYGQRVAGVVRITDVPIGCGRSFLVERGLEEDGYAALQAVVDDYVRQSQLRHEPVILVNLDHLVDRL